MKEAIEAHSQFCTLDAMSPIQCVWEAGIFCYSQYYCVILCTHLIQIVLDNGLLKCVVVIVW